MKILLTNDDGYRALGIQEAYNALCNAGHEVVIIAPELNSSGAGQSISIYSPIRITQARQGVYFVDSTPADSVRLGLQAIYNYPDNKPDLVISGINMGDNVGEDSLYSGTVGAAKEAYVHGIASLACSTPGPKYIHLDSAAKAIVDLVTRLARNSQLLATPFVWNVNIPNKPYDLLGGYETTELGERGGHWPLQKYKTPRGDTVYWQARPVNGKNTKLGTDIHIVKQGNKVSITPIKILATDYTQMPAITELTID